jgi:hypothetical protein
MTSRRIDIGLDQPGKTPKAVGRCVVCKGAVREVLRHHDAIHDPHGVIGPGYRPIRPSYTAVDGYACDDCGLFYVRPPPDKEHLDALLSVR